LNGILTVRKLLQSVKKLKAAPRNSSDRIALDIKGYFANRGGLLWYK